MPIKLSPVGLSPQQRSIIVAWQVTEMCLGLIGDSQTVLQIAVDTVARLNPLLGGEPLAIEDKIYRLSETDRWELFGVLDMATDAGIAEFIALPDDYWGEPPAEDDDWCWAA